MKAEYLMLAKEYKADKIDCTGWFVSSKLDGMLCFWDGGISKGKLAQDVPYANDSGRICSGLFSRYGKVISCPDDFTKDFPKGVLLVGELFAGDWNSTISAVKKYVPVEYEWAKVKYHVFDSPDPRIFFANRYINTPNMKKIIFGCHDFISLCHIFDDYRFKSIIQQLPCVKQTQIWNPKIELANLLIPEQEGLMLREPNSLWVTQRSKFLLKIKKLQDMEGTVVGGKWGEGKYLGMLGSLTIRLESGVVFDLSGFTDQEREVEQHVINPRPESAILGDIVHFPRGSKVTFRFRELGINGAPKEARYFRHET